MKKLVQSYIKPTSKILVHSTHPGGPACALRERVQTSELNLLFPVPGGVATGQTRQYNEAYGETVGGLIEAAVRPIMRSPDQGAVCPPFSAVAAVFGPSMR